MPFNQPRMNGLYLKLLNKSGKFFEKCFKMFLKISGLARNMSGDNRFWLATPYVHQIKIGKES